MNRNGTYLEMPKDQFAEILRECQLLIYPKPKTKEEEKKEKEARDKAAKSGLNHLEEKAVSPGDKPPSMSALTNDVKEAIKRDVNTVASDEALYEQFKAAGPVESQVLMGDPATASRIRAESARRSQTSPSTK